MSGKAKPSKAQRRRVLASSAGSLAVEDVTAYYRHNVWGVRVIRRNGRGTACVVKSKDFPDEVVLARGMWPHHAQAVVEEHNECLAKLCFKQDEPENDGTHLPRGERA